MSVWTKLAAIQTALKAPKGQENKFGGYRYRSCEDILEAVKPLLAEHGAVIQLSDALELVGQRYYIKATASLIDTDTGESTSVTAWAREAESRKGMDDSQITGSSSSYARKYALNGLLAIDDTRDADTMDNRDTGVRAQAQNSAYNGRSRAQAESNQSQTKEPSEALKSARDDAKRAVAEYIARSGKPSGEVMAQLKDIEGATYHTMDGCALITSTISKWSNELKAKEN